MKHVLPLILIAALWFLLPRTTPENRVVEIASLYVNHHEDHKNRSELIDYWNVRMGVPLGSNYCATFVSFVLDSAKVIYPTLRSARAQDYITQKSIPSSRVAGGKTIPAGYLAVWKRGNSWMGHVEIVREDWSGNSGKTIGANTSPTDSGDQRQGNGVYKKNRHIDHTAFFRLSHFTPTY